MLFEKSPDVTLLTCSTCHATGFLFWRKCSNCHGMAMGRMIRGKWLYWAYPLERYHLALERGRRMLNKIRFIAVLLLGLNFLIWAGFIVYRSNLLQTVALPTFSFSSIGERTQGEIGLLFLLGVACFSYLVYRSIREREFRGVVEHYEYKKEVKLGEHAAAASWNEVNRLPRRSRHNIADTFTNEALQVLGLAYNLADQKGYNTVTPFHLFYALLSFNRVSNIFIRLGIPGQGIQKQLAPLFEKNNSTTGGVHTIPLVGPEIQQILFDAYEDAYESHQEYVSVTELLDATVRKSTEIQEILYDLEIDTQKLINVVEWARIRERLYRQYVKFRHAASHRSKHGMDRAMTAVQTPYLNQFSDDLTMLAQFGRTEPCIARDKEIEEIFRIVEGGQESVLLVGDYGVGKKSIIEGLAERMVEDDVPDRLKDKRLVRLSVSALLAGTSPAGAVERLINIMNEIGHARNIILFIHNIQELIGVSAGAGESLDVAGTLVEYLSGGRFFTFATTTSQAYAQHISNSQLSNVFAKVEIGEMDENQAIQVLESKVGQVEYKQQVFFAYEAIEKAVRLSKRYLHDVYLPGSALEVMSEAASYARNKKGVNCLVTGEEVAAVVAEKTKIPVNTISSDETTKLLHLEEEMHKRVIGQEEAVNLVANALRRARAEIRSTSRPIASFLFLGPTGVGKTELAKTIAEVYFGGEARMVRLDMSEYQDKASIYRLLGNPGEKGTGVLTETIRKSPFALLLLDEIEKADKDILNLFLQVMDDGRLTDSTGRVVDFTNVIIIATSNAGTSYVQEQMRARVASEVIKDRLLHGELKEYFRPEFLNRFDGIVLFKPLDEEAIKQIAGLLLKRVGKDLEAKGITLQVEPVAVDFLAQIGFDPEFGARPMRRVLQERVENQLAELLLSGKLKRRDTVVIGEGGAISVR